MKVVIDTNILFSFFNKESYTRKLLLYSNLELISPVYALEELKKYSSELCKKSKISKEEFLKEEQKLKEIIKFINEKEYSEFLKEAEIISPDKKDMHFLALCFKHNCFLWSNDLILKNQAKIKVLSTEEIIEILF